MGRGYLHSQRCDMVGMGNKRGGFSLVELLVVIAITAVVMSLLLPSLTAARAVARRVLCAGNMKQHAMMTGQYGADAKGFLPMPSSAHRLTFTNLTGSGSILTGPNADLYLMSKPKGGNPALDCPMGTPKTMPRGYGWFYSQGYLPPVGAVGGRKAMTIMQCPGTPEVIYTSSQVKYGRTWMDEQEMVPSYRLYSGLTKQLASGNTDVYFDPYGTNAGSCCYSGLAKIDYINRGWQQTSALNYSAKVEKWKPGNAYAVDSETWIIGLPNSYDPSFGWMRKHTNGLNVGFIDGHVAFGAKDINVTMGGVTQAVPPAVYYSVTGASAETLINAYTMSSSGYPRMASTGDGKVVPLWTFYETGVP